jgi:hypothetical protein
MNVTFKCNKTGNTVTFKSQYDIESMRGHPEYTEVLPKNEQTYFNQEQASEQPKRGKPRKAEFEDSFTAKKD